MCQWRSRSFGSQGSARSRDYKSLLQKSWGYKPLLRSPNEQTICGSRVFGITNPSYRRVGVTNLSYEVPMNRQSVVLVFDVPPQ